MGLDVFTAFKGKGVYLIILICVAGILFLLGGSKNDNKSESSNNEMEIYREYKEELERTAASMCAAIANVETAQVNITCDGTVSCVYAKNSEGSYGGTYFSDGGEALFLKYQYPTITGCAALCSGDIDQKTVLEITQMLSSYLGIPSSKIYVGYEE